MNFNRVKYTISISVILLFSAIISNSCSGLDGWLIGVIAGVVGFALMSFRDRKFPKE